VRQAYRRWLSLYQVLQRSGVLVLVGESKVNHRGFAINGLHSWKEHSETVQLKQNSESLHYDQTAHNQQEKGCSDQEPNIDLLWISFDSDDFATPDIKREAVLIH